MLSLKDIAATKLAIEIVCNNSQVKKEIFCIPGSDYDANKPRCCRYRERQWGEILEKKARIVLEQLYLTKQLQDKVIVIVFPLGLRILSWSKYHENAIGFSRNYSFNFLNSSFFTMRGIVDCRKAATELINDKSLSNKEKYKVALYCMNEHIPALYKQLEEKDKQEYYDSEDPSKIKQPNFIKFWSYYLKDEADKVRGDTDPNLYWLKMAVKSGNKDGVEYCLNQTNLIKDESALIYAALEAVKRNMKGTDPLFVNWRILWVPVHYYIDIMCFLFSKMSTDTQIAFLKKDIKGLDYGEHPVFERSRVLEYFLDWPYQDYFLKTIRLMWDFLPEKCYFYLIKRFALKGMISYKYKKELSYDYTVLLWEFLNKIPESNKRYVSRDYEFDFGHGIVKIENAGVMLLSRLITQKYYTYQEKIIIEWILKNATYEEKVNIISSTEGMSTCTDLMALGRWKLLDEFVSNCYTSKDKVQKFKKELSFKEVAYNTCISFIDVDNWHEVESFIRWSALSNVEINQLKEKMILTEYGIVTCLKILSRNKLTAVDKVIRWCFSSEERVSAFKKELCHHSEGMLKCAELVTKDQVEIANEFIISSFSSSDEIRQYKIDLAYKIGRKVWVKLIFDLHPDFNQTYRVGNWEEVEKFVTWCFSSENDINDFKKYFTMKDSDGTRSDLIKLHFNLMLHYEWKDAKILFGWLNLSVKEIYELKKETILSDYCMMWMDTLALRNAALVNNLGYNLEEIWEKVELFLRWCLEDEDDVIEFRNKFDEVYGFKRYKNLGQDIPDDTRNNLNHFYSFIDEFHRDLMKKAKTDGL